MTTQVAVVYVPAGPFDEAYAYAAVAYCRSRGYFPAAVVHGDWRTVDVILKQHLAQRVVVARTEHPVRQRVGEAPRVERKTMDLQDLEQRAGITRALTRAALATHHGGSCQSGTVVDVSDAGFDSPEVLIESSAGEVEAYRTGYSDGYVDCLTIRGEYKD